MDAQVQNAVEIAWDARSDPSLKIQAMAFLEQLRSEPSAWRVCLSLVTREPRSSDVVRHVALEIVNHAIQLERLDAGYLADARDNLMEYVRRVYGGLDGEGQVDTSSFQNKIAQTIVYLFARLYGEQWRTFFDDFLALAGVKDGLGGSNVAGVSLYLRVVSAVHDEIADLLVPRSPAVQKRNGLLKDLVRQRDAQKVASSWQAILAQWIAQDDALLEMCLKVVGRWASWIDISLVINQGLMNLLLQLIGRTSAGPANDGVDAVRNAAIGTLTEIVGKKMQPADKLELIVFLNLDSIVAQLISSPLLHDLRSSSGYDTDLAEAVAGLVNHTASDIIKAVDNDGVDEATRQRADALLQVFLPHLLRFFADEYDEICSTVIPSLTELLTLLRKVAKAKGTLPPSHAAMLPPILNAIIAKTRYDETASWGNEDEQTDEAEFQELRKRLHVLQQAVAAVDEKLYMDVVNSVIFATFENLARQQGQIDWRDLDLALHEVFLFGDLAVKHGGLYTKNRPTGPAAETLIGIVRKMVESDIARFSHPAIQLQYMEICVRYVTFFEANPRLIPRVLEDFVRFVHHRHVRVRTRSWYLFQRFVKSLRAQLGDVAETVIGAIGDLLVIKAELPRVRSDDDLSSDESEPSADVIFTSQLCLFEAVGCMSSTSSVPLEKQVLYARSALNPLFSDLDKHLGAAKTGDELAVLQIHHDITAFGTLARGYSDWTPGSSSSAASAPAKEVSEAFEQGADAILVAMESLKTSRDIRTAARMAFSRLVGVLGARILTQLPRWIESLLSQSSTKDEMAMFLRLLDQVVYDFKTEIYSILDSLLTPLLQRVFAGLAEPTSGTDDEIQLAELRREYLNFLLIILNNDLGAVLVSSTNQNGFETLISTVEHFAKDVTDLPTAKIAYTLLTKMASQWGGPDLITLPGSVATTANNGPTASTPGLPGFSNFMITRFSPVCWALPTNPAFNAKDAQARGVLGEVAALQRTIYAKTGEEFLVYLSEVWFPGMQLGKEAGDEYVRALEQRDAKGFRQFFLAFVQRSGS
ncbi:MAG: pre-tRNA nuclear export protein [Thelocarpon impressellum]|nr:MAG: pre-tRNA nuclear export protein [Thelocarpon impressellum]